ncbi:MAG: hypothetical protein ACK5MT_11835 [Actinomycetales bacterium]
MSGLVHFPGNEEEFHVLEHAIGLQIDTTRRLPDWPFRAATAFARIYEFDRVLGGSFGAVLGALAAGYGDDAVTVACFDPEWRYYRDEYTFFPGFQIPGDVVGARYAEGLQHEPDDDPTGALAFTANVIGIAGSSRSWALWGQRDWEIALLLTQDESGPWAAVPVPVWGRDIDLASIRSPVGWGAPLSEQDLQTFWANVRDRGSGGQSPCPS